MALWSLKRIEVPIITSDLIAEAPLNVVMIDKDTGTIVATVVQGQFVTKKLDVDATLSTLVSDGYTPNDFGDLP